MVTENKTKPICKNCKHFDLEEGQAQLFGPLEHGAFKEAAQIIRPAQMGQKIIGYKDNGDPILEKPSIKMKVGWNDVGACLLDEVGVFKTGTCENFEAGSFEDEEDKEDEADVG